jgi:hypothetical protein
MLGRSQAITPDRQIPSSKECEDGSMLRSSLRDGIRKAGESVDEEQMFVSAAEIPEPHPPAPTKLENAKQLVGAARVERTVRQGSI